MIAKRDPRLFRSETELPGVADVRTRVRLREMESCGKHGLAEGLIYSWQVERVRLPFDLGLSGRIQFTISN